MKRNTKFLIAIGIVVAVFCLLAIQKYSYSKNNDQGPVLDRVYQRNALEKQAERLVENGDFDEAIRIYQQVLDPKYINYDYDKNTALGALVDIYKWQGKYEQAMFFLSELLNRNPDAIYFIMEKKEIEALTQYAKTGDIKYIYQHISEIKATYRDQLPPVKYFSHSTIYISDILRLYDTIGDYDAGIAFVDEILEYGFSRNQTYVKVHSSAEALERGYTAAAEYLKVREAFEQDKKEGKRGSMKEGTPGRATKALIQSDYFPW